MRCKYGGAGPTGPVPPWARRWCPIRTGPLMKLKNCQGDYLKKMFTRHC
jgi:hypothetical protein